MINWLQYVKKLFETNKGNFSELKPIVGRGISFNQEEIGAFGLEQFFLHIVSKRDKIGMLKTDLIFFEFLIN